MTTPAPRELFDGYYFAHGCGRPYARDAEWQAHFAGIADAIVRGHTNKTIAAVERHLNDVERRMVERLL